ncbi:MULTISPECIES: class I SAM-dependent DNA methyltransferase [Francisella]|uniref:site-specific DNA-methyltransferase (adenine-specific) n=1 Tax=Francisella opportunistica TaxID=2016517 RepID=A0A345JRY1_9GAMM|nr:MULTISPECIES: N-6 DNA methylase [Francisella]APC91834.1 Type I restriction-modification system, DNA-methyltransferase subunit M [Francisella sp. MA067296]AXH30077.1 DNA methyltransferase [Francisella opportunistica]AXH31721.1 DNA methyltransferase [Francisella opportunistica]AXH33367.1 DNA methyltransferase [Francisella opportunistica]
MQSKINRITDILRRDDGISGAMHYTEQVSWILFLKFLNDYENEKALEAELIDQDYTFVLDKKYRWNTWAAPKGADGKLDISEINSGADLLNFVNKELFPYLKSFKSIDENVKTLKYKIGAVFEYIDNRIASGHTLRDVINEIDELNFNKKEDLYQLSQIYENLLKEMGSDGGNSGEFYTPRPLVKAIVDVVNPKAGQTVYDPAAGTCGFLIDAYEHMYSKELSTTQLKFLNEEAFFGKEKTPLSYVMGMMNMILHGITSPNITKANTLVKDIRSLEEKDRYDIILANPPFGGKEKATIQANFPIKSNATELLFLQHIYKSLKLGGRCGVVVPEGVLFQTNNAFKNVKKELLENYNVHTIVSLPAGVFLPYSGVKTNVIFFDRDGSTTDIFYYEVNPPYKLTKNKPIQFEHFAEFLEIWQSRKLTENSWIVNVADIKDYDISAKNPNKVETIEHKSPLELVNEIKQNTAEIDKLIIEIENIIQ